MSPTPEVADRVLALLARRSCTTEPMDRIHAEALVEDIIRTLVGERDVARQNLARLAGRFVALEDERDELRRRLVASSLLES